MKTKKCDWCKKKKDNVYDKIYDKSICNDCKDSVDYDRWRR